MRWEAFGYNFAIIRTRNKVHWKKFLSLLCSRARLKNFQSLHSFSQQKQLSRKIWSRKNENLTMYFYCARRDFMGNGRLSKILTSSILANFMDLIKKSWNEVETQLLLGRYGFRIFFFLVNVACCWAFARNRINWKHKFWTQKKYGIWSLNDMVDWIQQFFLRCENWNWKNPSRNSKN